MKLGSIFLVLGAGVVGYAIAQPQAPARPPASKPSEAHANYEPLIGEWNMTWKEFGPDGKTEEFTGTQSNVWVVGKRWMQCTFRTENPVGDEKFHGIGYFGHDNVSGQYENVWFENARTGVQYDRGSYDPATRTFTYMGEQTSARSGKKFKTRTTVTVVDADKHLEAMWITPEGQPEVKVLEIECVKSRGEEAEIVNRRA